MSNAINGGRNGSLEKDSEAYLEVQYLKKCLKEFYNFYFTGTKIIDAYTGKEVVYKHFMRWYVPKEESTDLKPPELIGQYEKNLAYCSTYYTTSQNIERLKKEKQRASHAGLVALLLGKSLSKKVTSDAFILAKKEAKDTIALQIKELGIWGLISEKSSFCRDIARQEVKLIEKKENRRNKIKNEIKNENAASGTDAQKAARPF